MKGPELKAFISRVEPTTYSNLVIMENRGNGSLCWRLWFIKRGNVWDHEDFRPSDDAAKDREWVESTVRRHANEFIDSYAGGLS